VSAKVLSLAAPVVDKSDALEVLDDLRAAVERGEIIAFACVGIEPDDCTQIWSSSTKPTTRLKIIGAMAHMLHSYEADL
jgi:hypothetical protein